MAAPSLGLTFLDLQVRVAEYLRVADYSGGSAAAPADTHDLDLVQRIVNDGWRSFASANPDWNWLAPTFAIQFDADGSTTRTVDDSAFPAGLQDRTIPRAARYYMPDGFYGQMLSYFTYEKDGPLVKIDTVGEHVIRDNHAGAEASGDPFMSALRPLPALADLTDDANPRWEVIFYPTPESDDYVTGRCRIFPQKLVNDDDRHAAGFQFDDAVLKACLAEAERQREDATSTEKQQQYQIALAQAVRMDRSSKPRFMGYNGDYSDGQPRPRRIYTGVDSYTSGVTGVVNF
jgi:hypothetical protein